MAVKGPSLLDGVLRATAGLAGFWVGSITLAGASSFITLSTAKHKLQVPGDFLLKKKEKSGAAI